MLGQIPAVAEYFTAAAVLPLALADMEVCGAATERKVLDHAVFSEAMGDYGRIRPVLREKDLLLVQPDVKALRAFLVSYYVEIVYGIIRWS